MSDFAAFSAIVLAVVGSAVVFSDRQETLVFKLGAVVFLALLPASIYLQFVSDRVHAVWDEYVINLYQLGVDAPANLPEPPAFSQYHADWGESSRKAGAGTLYQQKFEALFGTVGRRHTTAVALRSQTALPVGIATFVIAVGWVLVAQPESVWNSTVLLPSSYRPAGVPHVPMETLRFAFLGAYFYILQMVIRRYFQSDLKPNAYVHATMRILVSMTLAWTVDLLMTGQSQPTRSAIAFVIGVFPLAGWQMLQALVAAPAKRFVPSLKPEYPLEEIDGLNVWYQSRLLELGIEDMQNLATANVVDVMLNTRIPVGRLVDWIDQALLVLHVERPNGKGRGESDLARLRRHGVRTATALEEALGYDHCNGSYSPAGRGLEGLLDRDGDSASVVRSITRSLATERNLRFVRNWRCHDARR